ncbi:hypothetical protein GGR28_002391 [Lewinella aquimaris]|uniref:DUF5723 domain-containing protein n=1 Tax=Neolewinella aquimaris TaxID=1835722 RepID=A0A840E2G1_9BACT|nr:DUF5723 family protein [Neolewinella aquimaris]MBB4079764.1 hypothetical protein [Neolewinella aquimaris]
MLLLLLSCLVTLNTLLAQGYPGLSVDNYSGVHGLLLNPASVAGSRTGTEINLASVAAFAANDYLKLNSTDIKEAIDNDLNDQVMLRTPGDDRSLNAHADVLGPSLLMSFGKHTGLGILTRARSLYTLRNMNGQLVEGTTIGFDELGDFTFDQRDHHSTLHTWGEVALVFGTEIVQLEAHVLKAGVSLKYLQGLGAVYTYGEALAGSYDAGNGRMSVDGDVTFGRAQELYYDDVSFDVRAGGVGFDLGLVYEWRPTSGTETQAYRPYRLRVAASIMDLGKITYDDTYADTYRLAGTIPVSRIEDAGDTESALYENFVATYAEESVDIGLPTALNLLVDYRLTGKLYVSALYTSPMSSDERLSNGVPTTLTLAPRVETRGFGLYLPYSFRTEQPNSLGVGMRLGPLLLGSGSLLSSVLSDGVQTVDVYAGIKLPFHRKVKKDKRAKAKGGDAGAEMGK